MPKPRIPNIRKGQAYWPLPREEFIRRYKARFIDPSFQSLQAQVDQLAQVAWENYVESHKAPRTRKAGPGYQDPNYDLSIDWIDARSTIQEAAKYYANRSSP